MGRCGQACKALDTIPAMFCVQCGTRQIESARFCGGCGAPSPVGPPPLVSSVPEAPPAATPAEASVAAPLAELEPIGSVLLFVVYCISSYILIEIALGPGSKKTSTLRGIVLLYVGIWKLVDYILNKFFHVQVPYSGLLCTGAALCSGFYYYITH